MSVGDIATAVSKTALYAAEPVAWINQQELRYLEMVSGNSGWGNHLRSVTLGGEEEGRSPLYAKPPAPSVAVKALEWREDWGGSDDDIVKWVADTPWGRVFASVAGYRNDEGKSYERHADVPDDLRDRLQAAAQADYEARIRSALSAQVQDVAGIENPSRDAYRAWLKRNGYPHTVARALAFEHGWRAHKKMAAAPAKPDGGGTYQESLLGGCRFESGSLTEAGWTVPVIAASKPAGDTRFADEAPAKQEGGDVTSQ